jgi:hypothetical protein
MTGARRQLALVATGAALALAGCGGSSGGTTSGRSTIPAENQHEISKLPPKQQKALRELRREASN